MRTSRAGCRRARCSRRCWSCCLRPRSSPRPSSGSAAATPQVNGPPELIQAPAGPYKVKPPNPGGLDVAGESETAFETSAGEDKDAQLDLSKVPETPVAKPPKEVPKTAPAQRDQGAAARRACTRAQAGGSGWKRGPARRVRKSRRRPSAPGRRCRRASRRVARDEQDDRSVPGRDPAARRGRLAGRREAGVPGAQGRGRELLRGAIGRCRRRSTGSKGSTLTDEERGFFRDADPAGLHPVPPQLRDARSSCCG